MVKLSAEAACDLEVFGRQSYGHRLGFGNAPALLLVDFVQGFMDEGLFGSGQIVQAMRRTIPLLALARAKRVPVFFTRIVFADDGSDCGWMVKKVPSGAGLTEANPASQVVAELAPLAGEVVLRKRQPSAFFGTDLAGLLQLRRVDTLLVTGCSTSGCVQASVVDAMSHGFRTVVVEDCVGDRHQPSHEVALLNMDMKYADVMASGAVMEWLGKETGKP